MKKEISFYKIYKMKNNNYNKSKYKLNKINLTLNKNLKKLRNLNNRN